MVAGVDQGNAFKRDMGYSESEFFRILPSAIAGYASSVEGNRVLITQPHTKQVLVLEIRGLPDRQIGNIRIPRLEVTFTFSNFADAERKAFLAGFDRSFQRGGG